jgi:hypothetical protein
MVNSWGVLSLFGLFLPFRIFFSRTYKRTKPALRLKIEYFLRHWSEGFQIRQKDFKFPESSASSIGLFVFLDRHNPDLIVRISFIMGGISLPKPVMYVHAPPITAPRIPPEPTRLGRFSLGFTMQAGMLLCGQTRGNTGYLLQRA